MKYNGSGYYDETPYKAYQNMNTAKQGEIWETSLGKEYLILKNHGNFCTVLSLCDTNRNNECIEIHSKAMKYTNPAMVQYVFNTALGEFVKAIPDDQYFDIMWMVAERLELKFTVIDERKNNDSEFKALEAKCRELNQTACILETELKQCEWDKALMESENLKLKNKLDSLENDYAHNNQNITVEVEKAKAETAFIQRMYDSLLDRFLGRGEMV